MLVELSVVGSDRLELWSWRVVLAEWYDVCIFATTCYQLTGDPPTRIIHSTCIPHYSNDQLSSSFICVVRGISSRWLWPSWQSDLLIFAILLATVLVENCGFHDRNVFSYGESSPRLWLGCKKDGIQSIANLYQRFQLDNSPSSTRPCISSKYLSGITGSAIDCRIFDDDSQRPQFR